MESCFHDGGYLGFPSEDEDIRRLLKMIDTDISPCFCAGVASPCLLQCFDAEESRVGIINAIVVGLGHSAFAEGLRNGSSNRSVEGSQQFWIQSSELPGRTHKPQSSWLSIYSCD